MATNVVKGASSLKGKALSGKGLGAVLGIGVVLVLLGGLAYLDQFLNGLGTTNLNNLFTWGLTIAVFAFLVGFGAGGQIVASLIVLRNGRPSRLAAISSVIGTACAIGAGIAIMVDLGNPLNILAMIAAPNPFSPLTWDMVSLTLFIVCSIVMSYLCMAPYALEKGRTRLYGWARKYGSAEEICTGTAKALHGVAIAGLVLAVVLQLVEGMIFALPAAHAWWHSILVPVDFLAVAVLCGASLAAGIGSIQLGGGSTLEEWDEVNGIAKLAAKAIGVHIVIAIGELVVGALAGGLEIQVLAEVFEYRTLYLTELTLPIAAAALFGLLEAPKHATKFKAAAVLVVMGMVAHRLMLLFPAFNVVPLYDGTDALGQLWEYPVSSGLTGGADAFVTQASYLPSIGEVGVSVLAIGVALILIGLAAGRYINRPE